MAALEAAVACETSVGATLRDLEARCVVRCSGALLIRGSRYQPTWRIWASHIRDATPAGRGWRPDQWTESVE